MIEYIFSVIGTSFLLGYTVHWRNTIKVKKYNKESKALMVLTGEEIFKDHFKGMID